MPTRSNRQITEENTTLWKNQNNPSFGYCQTFTQQHTYFPLVGVDSLLGWLLINLGLR